MMPQRSRFAALGRAARRASFAALAAWLGVLVAGQVALTSKSLQTDPAQAEVSPVVAWPAHSGIGRCRARTLVMFLHPRCPCSRATLAELERAVAASAKSAASAARPATQVVLVLAMPADAGEAWTKSPLARRCQQFHGAEVFVDVDGVEARRFGALVSGTVLAFDALGRRVYAGGVTARRGHEGPNVGADAVTAFLAGAAVPPKSLPPLGCRLIWPGDATCHASPSQFSHADWEGAQSEHRPHGTLPTARTSSAASKRQAEL